MTGIGDRRRGLEGWARIAALAGLALAFSAISGPVRAGDSAAVFLYHRFGEDAYPTTSIRIDQFEAQIAELKNGGYTVLPLPEIVARVRAGKPLPDFAVALTVDDAYESIVTKAWPRLKAAGFPLTIFVATDPIDRHFKDYMTWDQIRELAKEGVTIAAHSAAHGHMADMSAKEIADDIARSNARFKQELGFVPPLFAYPYGEMSLAVQRVVKESGYAVAFGQHSGVIGPGSDFFDLPRFALNEHFGGMAQFRERARALPLPVSDFTPADPLVTVPNPPAVAFTVDPGIKDIGKLACYGSERDVRVTHGEGNRIAVDLGAPLPPGRFRLSCTLPAGDGRFRWFGAPFYVAPAKR
jgi:peptidoglycan/xylan/chitin deacetylase (PgdA/CDA1 family)